MWPGKEEAKPKRQLALAAALKQVEMTYGKGSIMQLGSKEVDKVRKQVANKSIPESGVMSDGFTGDATSQMRNRSCAAGAMSLTKAPLPSIDAELASPVRIAGAVILRKSRARVGAWLRTRVPNCTNVFPFLVLRLPVARFLPPLRTWTRRRRYDNGP